MHVITAWLKLVINNLIFRLFPVPYFPVRSYMPIIAVTSTTPQHPRVFCTLPSFARIKRTRWRPRRTQRSSSTISRENMALRTVYSHLLVISISSHNVHLIITRTFFTIGLQLRSGKSLHSGNHCEIVHMSNFNITILFNVVK